MTGELEDNRRQFFRLQMDPCMLGHLTIISCDTNVSTIRDKNVGIVDLSAGGIKIQTTLDISFGHDNIFHISFDLHSQKMEVPCTLVRKEYTSEGLYEYALQSALDAKNTDLLVSLLNRVALQNRRGSRQASYTSFI